jgi:hypothetical protein
VSHACIVQESWDHVIPASPSVRKTPHLSPYQRRSLSATANPKYHPTPSDKFEEEIIPNKAAFV